MNLNSFCKYIYIGGFIGKPYFHFILSSGKIGQIISEDGTELHLRNPGSATDLYKWQLGGKFYFVFVFFTAENVIMKFN